MENKLLEKLQQLPIDSAAFRKHENNIAIYVEFGPGYDFIVTLHKATLVPEITFDYMEVENCNYIEDEQVFQLLCHAYTLDHDEYTAFYIYYSYASADTFSYNACAQTFDETPWDQLKQISRELLDKYLVSPDVLNNNEILLLPLAAEICHLYEFGPVPDELFNDSYKYLKQYFIKYDIKDKVSSKLLFKLNTLKYAPLWRELYHLFFTSQKAYVNRAAAKCSQNTLYETRKNIQSTLEKAGYTGEYPDFYKTGELNGLHLIDSYNTSYFMWNEKNVIYRIHCIEDYSMDTLYIQFVCGTEILKKNENPGDIYSCMFNHKGRRLCKFISHETDSIEKLIEITKIAVKTAELVRLTKEEQTLLDSRIFNPVLLFLFIFFVLGPLFGLCMVSGFILLTSIICLLCSQPEQIPDIVLSIPWWQVFLVSAIPFGGIMGFVTVLAKRK